MKFLLESQIESYLSVRLKPVEQIIGYFQLGEYRCIRWIEIQKDKEEYGLFLHEIFDDRNDGLDSIYEFSYVEPDDLYGKEIMSLPQLNKILDEAVNRYGASNNKYLTHSFLDEALEQFE